MNRIKQLFEQKKGNILTVYMTAGYPALHDTLPTLLALQAAGVDMVEVGIPFSDPLADGPTIQQSSEQALRNGMNVKLLLEQLQHMRTQVHIPVLFMGYLNPVLAYGIEAFVHKCVEIGIDGLILPDLPFDLYQREYRGLFEQHGLANVLLITPQTAPERIRQIDEAASGFIYMVSTASTTGARSGISEQQLDYFQRIAQMQLRTPRLIGFGIGDSASFATACAHAQGAIIGSAFIKNLKAEALEESIGQFIGQVR